MQRIKELRTSLGLTQTQFAEKLNINQATLSLYESQDRMPNIETLLSIAKKFNVSIDWLCEIETNSNTTLKTYADVIQLINELFITENLRVTLKTVNECNSAIEDKHDIINIVIDNSELASLIEEWNDIYNVCQKTQSGKKLYDIWLKDVLERYNKPIQKIVHNLVSIDDFDDDFEPFENSNDELPFK